MRAIFLADAHLKDEQDKNYRLFLQFLEEQRGTLDALFILGDLFDFWIGHRSMPFSHYRPVLENLLRLRNDGTVIHYFEGNHDFHLGPYFTEVLGAHVYRSAALLELDGKKIYACHGDQINLQDYGYRMLRFALHNRVTGLVVPFVPPPVTSYIAEMMARNSKRQYRSRETRWNYQAIIRTFAARRFAEGCDAVITGHFHMPFLEGSGPGRHQTTISLGDWISRFSYAEWDNGVIRLMTYQPATAILP